MEYLKLDLFYSSGKLGRTNLNLGRYSTAVVFFTSDGSATANGYELTIE